MNIYHREYSLPLTTNFKQTPGWVTNFTHNKENIYRQALEAYGDSRLEIRETAFDMNRRDGSSYMKSLHFTGKYPEEFDFDRWRSCIMPLLKQTK